MRLLTNKLAHSANERNGYSRKFWLMMSAFYALFIVRNIFSFHFPVPVYLAWVLIMALSFDDNEIKAMLVSFIPLTHAFQFKYAILICAFIWIIRRSRHFKFDFVFLSAVSLMAWEALHLGSSGSSVIEFLRGFAELIIIVVLMGIPAKGECNVEQFTRVLAISSSVAFIILLFATVEGRGETIMELLQRGFRFGISDGAEETFTFNYNANELGFICNIAISGLLININNKKAKIIDYAMIAFCIFIGLLTVSRTFLLCLVISFLLYILLQQTSVTKKIATITGITFAICILLLAVVKFFPEIIENYTLRFGEEDVTGGRSYLFEIYNELVFSSPDRLLFGIGIQNIAEKASIIMGTVIMVPHNGYQQLVVAWGIPGLILMVLFVYQIIKKANNTNPNPRLIYYLPFLILLINILAGQFVTVSCKMLSLILIYEILRGASRVAGEKQYE